MSDQTTATPAIVPADAALLRDVAKQYALGAVCSEPVGCSDCTATADRLRALANVLDGLDWYRHGPCVTHFVDSALDLAKEHIENTPRMRQWVMDEKIAGWTRDAEPVRDLVVRLAPLFPPG